MDTLRGRRAQEQPGNLEPMRAPAGPWRACEPSCGPPGHAHEAGSARRPREDEVPAGVISGVDLEGEGFAAGLRPGDLVVAVNGAPVRDVLEFQFLTAGEPAMLSLLRGEEELAVELPGEGPAGVHFEQELFDGLRRCRNNCVFCFVHQLPRRRSRRSLLVKDEDYRLSFLHGGYMTLGNLTEEDWERILDMRLSPLYVSVHATDTGVRNRMLGAPAAPPILEALGRLAAHGLEVHAQIVLVPGYNLGEELSRTLADLAACENVLATAVVPVGLTRHRERLPALRSLTPEEALDALDRIDAVRAAHPERPPAFGADELFQRAGRPLPPAGYYGEGFPLRDDGVGMLRSFLDALEALPQPAGPAPSPGRVALVTGAAAAPHFRDRVLSFLGGTEDLEVELVEVENEHFGPGVTVAGLLVGEDIARAVAARGRFDRVLIGEHAFQPGTELLLDDLTREDLERRLGARVLAVPDDPAALVAATRGEPLAAPSGSPDGADDDADAAAGAPAADSMDETTKEVGA